MKLALGTAIAAVALASASPSFAAVTVVAGGACSPMLSNPDAVACSGAFAGNLLNQDHIGDINQGLDILAGGSFSPDVVWSDLDPTKALFSGSGDDPTGTLTFAALTGNVIFGVHFGDAGTGLGDRTIFYQFNFANPTTTVSLGIQGFSDAIMIGGSPVPEPGAWAMMLIGFAGIGFAMRRRRTGALPQLA